MRNFVFAMNGAARAPAGGGTTASWFEYYKWDVGGEAFVPVAESSVTEPIEPGDLLWFVMDTKIVGYVPVLRVEDDTHGSYEVFYDTQKIIGKLGMTTFSTVFGTGFADVDADSFFTGVKLALDSFCNPRPSCDPPPVPQRPVE